MAQREITDAHGRAWLVWDVNPSVVVKEELRNGWLTFETTREKRRLTPTPEGWQDCTDTELLEMLDRATAVKPSRRLIE